MGRFRSLGLPGEIRAPSRRLRALDTADPPGVKKRGAETPARAAAVSGPGNRASARLRRRLATSRRGFLVCTSRVMMRGALLARATLAWLAVARSSRRRRSSRSHVNLSPRCRS